ncbi:MFS transporter [Lactiplantibacillus mudanjiangensis]|uniref:Carbohydrate transport domain / Chorismate mutase I [Lactobacillus zymae] n=1 Tax=Lactiplantibacillus mudanjiangensis TaxID=1296538 RepID=A0A660E2H4_9LACO|nr:MFS transporter [Lactiplantibacillus mudanjiangensis]VDG25943.1 Carbohydrate transport domain / Chorismate mutase I [Lactobacillus zymae] [Lactiplantibacillus mudanjiangensis]VDG28833.1 Carbohydrate transport domain / Chorismate mutase I [Lactobacillus zymae] [Lactiplantibacillus mudanjiangensis]
MQRRTLSLSLYLNYLVHGIGLIILTQNMQALSQHWQTPIATVSYVVSGIGVGRLLAYFLFGKLSDRYGRKLFINLGMVSYLIFFIGMAFVTNIQVAYGLAILAGIANSALDSGTYTTFIEMGGRQGSANVLIKAFMSAGEFILPLFIASLESTNQWYGWSFLLAAVILLVNLVLLNRQTFPVRNQTDASDTAQTQPLPKWRRGVASVSLAGYGYTSMAVMILYTQWISLFVTSEMGYSRVLAHLLLSLYSIGSITGVLVTFWLLHRGMAEGKLLVTMNASALVALLVVCYTNWSWLSIIASFMFGFTAAGGMMQVGLNLFIRLYPRAKGTVTGIFFTFGSIAAFTIPIVTGWLSKQSIGAAMRFDLIIGLAGVICVATAVWALRATKTLDHERQQINQIDQQIIHLLNQRFDTVTTIGELKQAAQLPVLDASREAVVLDRVAQKSQAAAHTPYLQAIYEAIMANSRAYQTARKTTEIQVTTTASKEELSHD